MASDLISREEAIQSISDWVKDCDNESVNDAVTVIKTLIELLPAVDAAPVVHARWVKMTGMMPPEYHGHYMCSNCEWHMKGLRNSWTREEELSYCPGCGAIMDGGEGDG